MPLDKSFRYLFHAPRFLVTVSCISCSDTYGESGSMCTKYNGWSFFHLASRLATVKEPFAMADSLSLFDLKQILHSPFPAPLMASMVELDNCWTTASTTSAWEAIISNVPVSFFVSSCSSDH